MKIIAMCPDFNDATSFYRGAWPLSRLQKWHGADVYFQKSGNGESIGWAELAQYDVLFLQRPYTDWNLKILTVAKDVGLKVWLDYDDDLYHVPFQNRASEVYSEAKTKDQISKLIARADLVTFSTEKLRETMRGKNQNAAVVPNATDFDLLDLQKKPHGKKLEKSIFWRGSSTHDNDLFLYAEELKKIAVEFPEWRFVFLGSPWKGILHYIPKNQVVIVPPVRIPEYFGLVQALQPEIVVVPLEECLFNQCKSNIAWQEGTVAGASVLAPHWKEWKIRGVVHYGSVSSFGAKLKTLILDKGLRLENAAYSMEALIECYNLRRTVEQRHRLLERMLSC